MQMYNHNFTKNDKIMQFKNLTQQNFREKKQFMKWLENGKLAVS